MAHWGHILSEACSSTNRWPPATSKTQLSADSPGKSWRTRDGTGRLTQIYTSLSMPERAKAAISKKRASVAITMITTANKVQPKDAIMQQLASDDALTFSVKMTSVSTLWLVATAIASLKPMEVRNTLNCSNRLVGLTPDASRLPSLTLSTKTQASNLDAMTLSAQKIRDASHWILKAISSYALMMDRLSL